MVVFIDAYEHIYEGLHEMSVCGVFEFDCIEEAEEMAINLSLGVIESYSCINDCFEGIENEDELLEDIAFIIYEVKDSILEKFALWELDKIAAEIDEEEFIECYCVLNPISVC